MARIRRSPPLPATRTSDGCLSVRGSALALATLSHAVVVACRGLTYILSPPPGNGAGEITAYDLAAVTGSTVSGPDAGVRLVTRWSAHDGPVASLTVIPPLSRGVRSKADSAAANDAGVDDPMNLHVASGGSGGDCRVMLHSGVGEFVGVFGQERAWVMRQSVDEECGAAATAAAKRRGPAAASRRAAAGQRRAAAAAGGGGVQPSPGGGGRPPRASVRVPAHPVPTSAVHARTARH